MNLLLWLNKILIWKTENRYNKHRCQDDFERDDDICMYRQRHSIVCFPRTSVRRIHLKLHILSHHAMFCTIVACIFDIHEQNFFKLTHVNHLDRNFTLQHFLRIFNFIWLWPWWLKLSKTHFLHLNVCFIVIHGQNFVIPAHIETKT